MSWSLWIMSDTVSFVLSIAFADATGTDIEIHLGFSWGSWGNGRDGKDFASGEVRSEVYSLSVLRFAIGIFLWMLQSFSSWNMKYMLNMRNYWIVETREWFRLSFNMTLQRAVLSRAQPRLSRSTSMSEVPVKDACCQLTMIMAPGSWSLKANDILSVLKL